MILLSIISLKPFKEVIGGILSALIYGSLFGSLCDVTDES